MAYGCWRGQRRVSETLILFIHQEMVSSRALGVRGIGQSRNFFGDTIPTGLDTRHRHTPAMLGYDTFKAVATRFDEHLVLVLMQKLYEAWHVNEDQAHLCSTFVEGLGVFYGYST